MAFPVISRLRCWFTTRKEAQLLRWHKEARKKLLGKISHLADAKQWGNINSYFEWFDDDDSDRNVQFSMSIDGINPFGNSSSTHRTWPVVLSVYNLPPWQ
jgi:hypothetical protein